MQARNFSGDPVSMLIGCRHNAGQVQYGLDKGITSTKTQNCMPVYMLLPYIFHQTPIWLLKYDCLSRYRHVCIQSG